MTEMWKHQKDAVTKALMQRDLGLLFEMGTGKSRTVVEILRRKYAANGEVVPTLIFAPPAVCPNWREEFRKFSKIPQHLIVVLQGSGKKRAQTLLKELGPELNRPRIVVTNYEAVEMKELYHILLAWTPKILICDESQRLKNPQSVRAKNVVKIADRTENNYILTGTPVLNSPMDLYMQWRILDRGKTFGNNFFAFRNEYFFDGNAAFKAKQSYFPNWQIRKECYDKIQDKLAMTSVKAKKSECLDLPPLLREKQLVTMSPEQVKAYKQMYNDFIAVIEDNKGKPQAVTANIAVVKSLRLQQIVCGFVKDDNDVIHRFKDVPRLKALGDMLEELTPEHKVIVWAGFHEAYAMIAELCDSLGIKYTELHGGISAKQKQDNMDLFRTDDSIRVMIANQAAGGVGVNLVEASYAIYYSKSFRLEDDLQSEARNYRGGSEIHTKVTRVDLVCPGTIDELVTEALANKQQVAEHILAWRDKLCEGL